MTADVSFVVEELPDALLVPSAALRFRPPGAAALAPGGVAGAAGTPPGEAPVAQAGSNRGAPAQDGPRRARRVVWALSADGTLRQVPIRVGPSDGKNTAVLGGELAEGDRVVVGTVGGEAQGQPGTRAPQQGRPPMGRFL